MRVLGQHPTRHDPRRPHTGAPRRSAGPSVTVAGLLSGVDILRALSRMRVGDLVLVPAAALRDGVFLDNMTVDELSAAVGAPVIAAGTPAEAWRACRGA